MDKITRRDFIKMIPLVALAIIRPKALPKEINAVDDSRFPMSFPLTFSGDGIIDGATDYKYYFPIIGVTDG